MIDQQQSLDQLPNEIKPAFLELNVLKHLRGAGFKKKFGFTCAYLFRLVFVLLFHQKNWFRLLESEIKQQYDTILALGQTEWVLDPIPAKTGPRFRSFISTLRKQGLPLYPSLVAALRGQFTFPGT